MSIWLISCKTETKSRIWLPRIPAFTTGYMFLLQVLVVMWNKLFAGIQAQYNYLFCNYGKRSQVNLLLKAFGFACLSFIILITDDLVPGLEYVKQLCVPEYNTVEMEVASK